jgi:hypothetical protein
LDRGDVVMFEGKYDVIPRTYSIKSYRRRTPTRVIKFLKYLVYLIVLAAIASIIVLSMNHII